MVSNKLPTIVCRLPHWVYPVFERVAKSTFFDVVVRMGGLFFAKGTAFLTSVLIARAVGPGNFGHISVAQGVLAACGIFTGAGLIDAMFTYVSKERAIDIKYDLFFNALVLNLGTTLSTLVIAFLVLYLFNPLPGKEGTILALVCLPTLIFSNINQLLSNYIQSFGSVRIRTLMETTASVVYSVAIIVLTLSIGIYGWAIGMNLGYFLAFLLSALCFHKFLIRNRLYLSGWMPRLNKNIIGSYLKYLRWSTLGKALNVAMYGINSIIIVALVQDADKVGIFSAAMLIFSAFGLYAQSITQSIYHKVAAKHRDVFWLKRTGLRIKIFALIPLAALILVASGLSNIIIELVYGEKYHAAGPVLSILLIASFFQNYIYLNGGIWIAIGKIKPHTLYFAIVSTAYLILVIVLTAKFSIKGAAFAMLFSAIFGAVMSEMINYKYIWTK